MGRGDGCIAGSFDVVVVDEEISGENDADIAFAIDAVEVDEFGRRDASS